LAKSSGAVEENVRSPRMRKMAAKATAIAA
jgi:hypothetical protein